MSKERVRALGGGRRVYMAIIQGQTVQTGYQTCVHIVGVIMGHLKGIDFVGFYRGGPGGPSKLHSAYAFVHRHSDRCIRNRFLTCERWPTGLSRRTGRRVFRQGLNAARARPNATCTRARFCWIQSLGQAHMRRCVVAPSFSPLL
jgi:hypothetical protein